MRDTSGNVRMSFLVVQQGDDPEQTQKCIAEFQAAVTQLVDEACDKIRLSSSR